VMRSGLPTLCSKSAKCRKPQSFPPVERNLTRLTARRRYRISVMGVRFPSAALRRLALLPRLFFVQRVSRFIFLCAIGIYGVMAVISVAQRRYEFGVRTVTRVRKRADNNQLASFCCQEVAKAMRGRNHDRCVASFCALSARYYHQITAVALLPRQFLPTLSFTLAKPRCVAFDALGRFCPLQVFRHSIPARPALVC